MYLKGLSYNQLMELYKEVRAKLRVPVLPFSKIDEMGAGMYKEQSITRAERHIQREE